MKASGRPPSKDPANRVDRRSPPLWSRAQVGVLAVVFAALITLLIVGEARRRQGEEGNRLPDPRAPAAGSGAAGDARHTSGGPPAVFDPDAVVDAVLKAREDAANKALVIKAPESFDRSLIEEGDGLRGEAETILRAIRERKVSFEDKNDTVDRAIRLLDSAREKYETFSEQFPDRQRLVEGSIEEINSLIFFARRQKSVRKD